MKKDETVEAWSMRWNMICAFRILGGKSEWNRMQWVHWACVLTVGKRRLHTDFWQRRFWEKAAWISDMGRLH
jgi:hypothetical protein